MIVRIGNLRILTTLKTYKNLLRVTHNFKNRSLILYFSETDVYDACFESKDCFVINNSRWRAHCNSSCIVYRKIFKITVISCCYVDNLYWLFWDIKALTIIESLTPRKIWIVILFFHKASKKKKDIACLQIEFCSTMKMQDLTPQFRSEL